MKIIGIDPSLAATGIAGFSGELATIIDKVGDGRLNTLYFAVMAYADTADLAVLEDLPVNAMSAGATGMAQGVVRLALIHSGVPYVLVSPATLKKFATGRGNATKGDMRMALYQRFDLDLRDDNQVDARWLQEAGLARYDIGVPRLPKSHIEALNKVDWTTVYAA